MARGGGVNSSSATVNRRDDDPNDANRNVRSRKALEPVDISFITNRLMNKTEEITVSGLIQPKATVSLKNHVNCMLIRMIANKNGAKNDTLVRTYNRQSGNQKVTKTQTYTRLFSVMMLHKGQPTSRMAYIMEDHVSHGNLWDFSTNIRDNGGVLVGTVIRLHHVKPIEKMMADDCPAIITAKPAVVLNNPISMNEVKINYQVPAGIPCAFVLNNCSIDILDSEPIKTGCGGLFCDKQRCREVSMYGQGCCCFRFHQRRPNMEIIHTMLIKHISLEEPMYVQEYSSTKFSLLFQTALLNCELNKTCMDMTDNFFNLQEKIEDGVKMINDNGGFTIIGWYKRGHIQDRTVLVQNANEQNANKYNVQTNQNTQVDNSVINFHPCVVRPSNKKYYEEGSTELKNLKDNKFDVNQLMSTA